MVVAERADEPIRIAAYDAEWPVRFERERAVLDRAAGPWAVGGIHHVGSTAVPGLDAKPIIDILVGVVDLDASRACFDSLAELSYLYAPYRPEEMHWSASQIRGGASTTSISYPSIPSAFETSCPFATGCAHRWRPHRSTPT